MANVDVDVRGVVDVAGQEEDALRRPALGRPLLWLLGIFAIGIFFRVYQQIFAWKCGESTAPCYARIWMPFLYVELAVWSITGSAWFAWLAKGCKTCDAQREAVGEVDARHESQHIWSLMGIILALAMAVYWGGSYFAEEDGSWHQIAVRDTAFTPAHIMIFYGTFPVFIILGIGAYLYARTRVPVVFRDRGFPFCWGLVLAATLMEMFQVAFNEWSHSFWIAEEIFAAPFHWGFVLWGYFGAGIFGVWGLMFGRMFHLLDKIKDTGKPQKRVPVEVG